jgi:hypothetical protein
MWACFLAVLEVHVSITADFFRNRLDQMIDLRHPLAVLTKRMPWQEIEASLAHLFARQVRTGQKIEDAYLFGSTEGMADAGVPKAGRPRLPIRLMVSLLYLKHAFNESDKDLIPRWGETPTWQYFAPRNALNTAGLATQLNGSNAANCWAKKACKNAWPARQKWP